MASTTALAAAPGRTPPRRHARDLLVVGVEAALLAVAVLVGALLNARDAGLHADAAPLYATWRPHVGWGSPAALAVAVAVVGWGARWARTARWGVLLTAAWLTAVAWTLSLALVDGWTAGLTRRLTPQAEYLHEVPGVTDIPAMLAGFAGRIVDFEPGSWSTHTAGHPPGALLIFVWLDRIGLGGGAAAGLACVLVGATVAVSVPVTLRALGAPDAARAVLPFLVLLPGAVWVGASADGIFAAVVAAGLALLAVRGRVAALAGGAVLGFALYLSYGFLLVGVLALTVVALRRTHRRGALLAAVVGVAAVAAAFTAAGFHWWVGYHLVVERYYQGWAADRPYAYWVWANLAALLLSAGPVLGPALLRVLSSVRSPWPGLRAALPARTPTPPGGPAPGRPRFGPGAAARGWRAVGRLATPAAAAVRAAGPTVLLPLAALVAVLGADLSGLSKAEVERIWLPFIVWLLVATARLPVGSRRWWLAAQALTALAVNHLVWTVS